MTPVPGLWLICLAQFLGCRREQAVFANGVYVVLNRVLETRSRALVKVDYGR